jgi:hypothetical protein
MKRLKFAVITTHNRPRDYRDCLAAIRPQVDQVYTVSHHAPYTKKYHDQTAVITFPDALINISEAWNLGLRAAAVRANSHPYDVAVLNDDAIVPETWFETVTASMRRLKASAGAARRRDDPRMAGFAFILDGGAGIYADEQFQWWYGDTDIERRVGTVAQPNGLVVEHRHPNSTTIGALAEIAKADARRYDRKWA